MRTYVTETFADSRPFAETSRPEAHPATLSGEYYRILLSAERDGTMNIYRAGLSESMHLAVSPGFDGEPAGEPVAWKPDPAESLAWLAGH
jgi:hypothetical protein